MRCPSWIGSRSTFFSYKIFFPKKFSNGSWKISNLESPALVTTPPLPSAPGPLHRAFRSFIPHLCTPFFPSSPRRQPVPRSRVPPGPGTGCDGRTDPRSRRGPHLEPSNWVGVVMRVALRAGPASGLPRGARGVRRAMATWGRAPAGEAGSGPSADPPPFPPPHPSLRPFIPHHPPSWLPPPPPSPPHPSPLPYIFPSEPSRYAGKRRPGPQTPPPPLPRASLPPHLSLPSSCCPPCLSMPPPPLPTGPPPPFLPSPLIPSLLLPTHQCRR